MPRIAAAVLTLTLTAAATAQASAGDPAVGRTQFAPCSICHGVQPAQPDRIGPNLAGIYRAGAATRRPKFPYSPALKASKLTWDEATLDRWLAAPATTVPGTKMMFPGMPNKAARQNVIAYLKTLK